MSSSVITDINLGGNSKQSVNGGSGGNGRRKTKNDVTQKKNKQPGRGMGVAQLERIRLQDNRWKTINELQPHAHVHVHDQIPSFNPSLGFTPYRVPVTAPAMFVPQIHGGNLCSNDHVVDPIGSSGGYLMKCGSDCCGVCHKVIKSVFYFNL